ncbi:hypothetical protein [Nocardia sp. NPDC046763]|uniref:hypothetical protein n=1 Tax=Nocardia sp. NPDC046763 TaxID=3155256 RepID=UPI0033DC1430
MTVDESGPGPRWHGDHEAWKRSILSYGTPLEEDPVSDRARDVAVAVFQVAARYNTLFVDPLECQIYAWAWIFDCTPGRACRCWLTAGFAVAAVRAHFAKSQDGRMLPSNVLCEAGLLRLEVEANHGA